MYLTHAVEGDFEWYLLKLSTYELELLIKVLDDNSIIRDKENDRLDKMHKTLYGAREKIRRVLKR